MFIFSHSFVYFFVTIGGTLVLKAENMDGLVEKTNFKRKIPIKFTFLITSYRFITGHFLPIWPPMVAYHKCHEWTKF